MSNALLQKLLLRTGSRSRLWFSLCALCVGTTLLLVSVAAWWNFKELLEGKHDNDSLGSTFLTIGKKVTDQTMGDPKATLFNTQEIEQLRTAPEVQEVGVLSSNRFPVYATFSSSVGFATEMFLEAVDDTYIDKKPADWHWQEGDRYVPVIISSDFLNLYNYGFALSQGLPQLSETSIKAVSFELMIGRGEHAVKYQAHVAGFSDRISSVLVPQSFIQYGNQLLAPGMTIAPSRLIVKAKDPSSRAFVQYLEEHGYTTNAEQLRWNKLRSVVEIVSGSTGLLAILLMGIGAMVFVLFIELTIAKAQASLQLLLQLGYSPRYLRSYMQRHFVPYAIGALVCGAVITTGMQAGAAVWGKNLNLSLSTLPGWPVWAALCLSLLLLLAMIRRAISEAIS